ncbi:hypothetical protein D3C78_1489930 [compost metagenome]
MDIWSKSEMLLVTFSILTLGLLATISSTSIIFFLINRSKIARLIIEATVNVSCRDEMIGRDSLSASAFTSRLVPNPPVIKTPAPCSNAME